MARSFTLRIDGKEYGIELRGRTVLVNGRPYEPKIAGDSVTVGDVCHRVELSSGRAIVDGVAHAIDTDGFGRERCRGATAQGGAPSDAPGAVTAIMPGLIIKVLVSPGDHVAAGGVVVVLEAMKMENELCASREGEVKEVKVRPGESVQQGQVLVVIE